MVEEAAPATAPRRFAPNGAKAALHGGAREPQQPSFVFLRVKRKRHEDPVECLLVASEPETKRQQRETATAAAAVGEARAPSEDAAASAQAVVQPHDLLAAFTKLSTRECGFVFTRIDTLESHQLSDASDPKWAERLKKKAKQQRVNAKKAADKPLATTQQRAQQQQARLKERRHSDALRTRGLVETPPKQPLEMREHKTLELSGVRMVELTTVAVPDTAASSSLSSSLTVNGAALGVKRVMNPYEREVDEAVWTAFQHNDFSAFFRLFHAHRPDRRVDPAAFQRPADGGTILMAAAMHGRADVIEAVLRSSAANVLHEDWSGATAAAFALRGGHTGVHTALLACEAAEREKEFVYDVYCIDTSAQQQQQNDAVASDLSAAPVVSVSSAVQRWLTQEADQRHDDDDDVDDFVLESDQEDDIDSDGSIDSNHENYAFNDYPDEEDDDDDGSDYESDDSEQELRHRAAGTGKSRRVDERVCADEVDY